AGEGLLFLYLAYKYVKPGGVIAFVLPRNVLSGVSWFLARALLASKFHVKYVIVSNDTEDGYNFSEGTSLSEALIVARRVDNHEPSEETRFVILMKKPRTAIDAVVLADRLLGGNVPYDEARVITVSRTGLLKNLDNWGLFIAFNDVSLIEDVISVTKGEVCGIKVPIALFNDIMKTIGIDRHEFRDIFERVRSETPYPILYGGGEEVRTKMLIEPNAYARPKDEKRAKDKFSEFSSSILLPDRVRVNTAHVIAIYSERPILSNIFYAVKLRCNNADKALVVWLNTTWGLITILANREETEGAFAELKMSQWRLLPILNVCALDDDALRRLSGVFDRYANKEFKRITEQYGEETDLTRLSFDLDFLRALSPGIDENSARQCLTDLYRRLGIALRTWIGKDD
ncbi:MAG: N-6 DNA methylase, partial [Vulcanisaeta sp.]